MKIALLSILFMMSTNCFTADDITRFKADLTEKAKSKPKLGNFANALDHPYFEKFQNYGNKLMSGGFGFVMKASMDYFQLESPPYLPVALKIFFNSLDNDWVIAQEYMKMMIPGDLQMVNPFGKGSEQVLQATDFLKKVFTGEKNFKTKFHFMGQVYEAARLEIEGVNGKPLQMVCFAMQLGFADWSDHFVDPTDMSRNSDLILKSMVEASLGLAELHNAGLMHGDLKLQNIMMVGDQTNFSPIFIDFDKINSFGKMEQEGFLITKEMFLDQEKYQVYWESKHCYVTFFGGFEKNWMKIKTSELNLKAINPKTNRPYFSKFLKNIIPISPDYSEETSLFIEILIKFLLTKGFCNTKDPSLKGEFDHLLCLPTVIDLENKTLIEVYKFLKSVNVDVTLHPEARFTSQKLFKTLSHLTGITINLPKIPDSQLTTYFHQLQEAGYDGSSNRELVESRINHLLVV